MKKKANLNVAAFFLAALMLIAEIAYCPQQVMAKEGELIPMTIEGVGTIYYSLDEKNNASIDKFVIAEGVSGKINFTVPSKVETVTEETQVSYPVKKIGVCAFMNCNIFKSVTIPTSVTTLSNGAFYNCKNLKSLIFKSKSTKVGKYAVGYVAASSAENVNVGTEENEIMSDPKRIDSLVITGTSKKAEASKYCAKNGFTFKYKSGSKTKYIYGYPTIKVSNSSSGITVRWAKVGLVNNYYVYKTTD